MTTNNPHALDKAQDDGEVFELMQSPPDDFDMFRDKPISSGKGKARKLVHRDQDWHRSVHVWIIDRQTRRLVMQKRSPQKDTYPNRYDISAAGHIEYGDDSRETAIREVAEELGIACTKEELEYVFTCPAQQAPLGCNCYEDAYFLARKENDCNFAIGETEVTDVKWVAIDELKQLLHDEDPDYVPRVKKYQNAFFEKLASFCQNNSN